MSLGMICLSRLPRPVLLLTDLFLCASHNIGWVPKRLPQKPFGRWIFIGLMPRDTINSFWMKRNEITKFSILDEKTKSMKQVYRFIEKCCISLYGLGNQYRPIFVRLQIKYLSIAQLHLDENQKFGRNFGRNG